MCIRDRIFYARGRRSGPKDDLFEDEMMHEESAMLDDGAEDDLPPPVVAEEPEDDDLELLDELDDL